MSKPTRWNINNPIYIFNQEVLKTKKFLRQLSKKELPDYAKKMGVVNYESMKHGTMLRACLAVFAINFKKEWKAKYGWELDEARDIKKLNIHIANMKKDRQLAMNADLLEALIPFIDKESSVELSTEMRDVAMAVAEKHDSTNIASTELLYKLVEDAKKIKFEKAKANKEIPAEMISWQKAKGLFGPGQEGNELYQAAKESGEGITEDGKRLTYVGKKWYLHA